MALFILTRVFCKNSIYLRVRLRERFVNPQFRELFIDGAVPKVMSVALIELVEMTATLKMVVSTLRQAQGP